MTGREERERGRRKRRVRREGERDREVYGFVTFSVHSTFTLPPINVWSLDRRWSLV